MRRLRERDGNALKSSARVLKDPLSPAGQRVLSKITEAGDDWFAVRRLYSSYTGKEVQIFNAVMHAAVRCGQLKQGAQIYEKLCDLKITKTYPTFTAALKIFAELGQSNTVRKLWKEAKQSLDLVGAYATAPLDKIESTYRTMQEIGVKPNRVFSEIYLTSVLAIKKAEAYDKRTVRQLTSYLRSCPQKRLQAARAALDDFENAKLETTTLCNKIDAALQLLEVED